LAGGFPGAILTWVHGVRTTLCVLRAVLFAWLALAPLRATAEESDGGCSGAVCGLDEVAPSSAVPLATTAQPTLLFFWGVGCPHCEEAKPFVDALEKEEPRLRVERIEVRADAAGRARFIGTMEALGASAVGVPTFVIGDAYVVGYAKGATDEQIRALVSRALGAPSAPTPPPRTVRVPHLGELDPASVSLPALTLAMGLADGVNPCAIWVLVVLLGILLHVKSPKRMLLYAGTFVLMSGLVYFGFMTAWSALFVLVGLSRAVTMVLGGALLGMGLVNLKDVVWFKKGVSLVIPDKAKPSLFRRMRAVAGAATAPAALAGIALLAFVVNLVELGCTLGLPAVYTRVLSLRGLGTGARLAHIALYNVAYVVPLLVVVIAFVALKRRIAMTERTARALKGVSGLLLSVFGALFLLTPDLLAKL
jgi:thiol-disulfide isomerase/thioredoxin